MIYWITKNLTDCPGDNNWLAEQEKAVLDKLNFTKRRSDWRLGRWTAKQVIKNFLSQKKAFDFVDIEILADDHGAPQVFLEKQIASFSISISHSRGVAMSILNPNNKPVGCDIEFIEARDEKFVADYFTQDEMAWVRNTGQKQEALVTNLIWSAKESTLKVLREGLRLDTRFVNIIKCQIVNTDKWQPLEIWFDKSKAYFGLWKIIDGYVLTIVSEEKNFQLGSDKY